eukprot:6040847-Karenia_brevis.AAC.1
MTEIDALIADSMSYYERFMLAKSRIEAALELPRLVPRVVSEDPNDHATKINRTAKAFLAAKHARVACITP